MVECGLGQASVVFIIDTILTTKLLTARGFVRLGVEFLIRMSKLRSLLYTRNVFCIVSDFTNISKQPDSQQIAI